MKKTGTFFNIFYKHLIAYPTPGNLNYFWNFGSLSGLLLVIQIVTGLLLSLHYTPQIDLAFSSVEHIMRDVNGGWLFRYMHANGASMFFIVVYLHILRALYFRLYFKKALWFSGLVIYILMMAAGFMGYVLPWGQMSFWGATVITNFFTAIPYIGDDIAYLIWGGFSVSNATLNRFFSLHFLIPFIIAALVVVHISLLHVIGSSNPKGIESKINFNIHPFFWLKDLFGVFVLLFFFFFLVFFKPNLLGHCSNYITANPAVTPLHIVPEWYFLPFYAILRSIPNKLGGLIFMVAAIAILFVLPFIKPQTKLNNTYMPTTVWFFYRFAFFFFLADLLFLGWLGNQSVETPYLEFGQIATALYFLFFVSLYFINTLDANMTLEFTKKKGINK